jgi:hypothetical protein
MDMKENQQRKNQSWQIGGEDDIVTILEAEIDKIAQGDPNKRITLSAMLCILVDRETGGPHTLEEAKELTLAWASKRSQ